MPSFPARRVRRAPRDDSPRRDRRRGSIVLMASLGIGALTMIGAASDSTSNISHDLIERVETAVQGASAAWTIVRPSWFAQNFSEGFFAPALAA